MIYTFRAMIIILYYNWSDECDGYDDDDDDKSYSVLFSHFSLQRLANIKCIE